MFFDDGVGKVSVWIVLNLLKKLYIATNELKRNVRIVDFGLPRWSTFAEKCADKLICKAETREDLPDPSSPQIATTMPGMNIFFFLCNAFTIFFAAMSVFIINGV